MTQERFVLTRSGYHYLQAELDALELERNTAQADFADANDDSDSSPEEAALFEAKVAQEFDEEQYSHLKTVLERAEVIEDDPHPEQVDPGERVTVWDFAEQQERIFNVVSSTEAVFARDGIPGEEVSAESPVGKALLGSRIGDVIEIEVPDGSAHYAVRNIEPIT